MKEGSKSNDDKSRRRFWIYSRRPSNSSEKTIHNFSEHIPENHLLNQRKSSRFFLSRIKGSKPTLASSLEIVVEENFEDGLHFCGSRLADALVHGLLVHTGECHGSALQAIRLARCFYPTLNFLVMANETTNQLNLVNLERKCKFITQNGITVYMNSILLCNNCKYTLLEA